MFRVNAAGRLKPPLGTFNLYKSIVDLEKDGNVQKVRIFENEHQLSFAQVFTLWQSDGKFRDYYIEILKSVPFESYRWEAPPVSLDCINHGYEFVIFNSPYLSKSANPTAFSEYFRDHQEGDGVVIFPNLGKDAVLIVPTPIEKTNVYAHMASFLRGASKAQVHAMWKAVGEAMKKTIGHEKIWLNTAGGGVPWLHVRLDSRPKYYMYNPYRNNEY